MKKQKVELLESIGKVIKAIDDEVDWFLAYKDENDPAKKKLYLSIYESKKQKLKELAKSEGEKYNG